MESLNETYAIWKRTENPCEIEYYHILKGCFNIGEIGPKTVAEFWNFCCKMEIDSFFEFYFELLLIPPL